MTEFCNYMYLKREEVKFMYNGAIIYDLDTPNSIGLRDGDKIGAFDRLIDFN